MILLTNQFILTYIVLTNTCNKMKPTWRLIIQTSLSEPAEIRAFLVTEYDFPRLRAVCAYSGQSGSANITWLLPDNNTAERVVSSSVREGSKFRANASYEFPLERHEGRALTCIIHQEHGPVERRVVEVPLYCEYSPHKSASNQGTQQCGGRPQKS